MVTPCFMPGSFPCIHGWILSYAAGNRKGSCCLWSIVFMMHCVGWKRWRTFMIRQIFDKMFYLNKFFSFFAHCFSPTSMLIRPLAPISLSEKWQRTICPGSTSAISGSSRVHFSWQYGHLGPNGQPSGSSESEGVVPLIGISDEFFFSVLGRASIRPFVYGCLGLEKSVRVSAVSTK